MIIDRRTNPQGEQEVCEIVDVPVFVPADDPAVPGASIMVQDRVEPTPKWRLATEEEQQA